MNLKRMNKCEIIAEISANHGQEFGRAIELIKKAKDCGADVVKFQTYTPDTLTLDVDNKYFRIKHPKWGGQTLHHLYEKAYTPWDWFPGLKKAADKAGIGFLSTVFDKKSVDLLENLGVCAHKISSFELVDLPLIKYVAGTKKPLIMSTGMATLAEIEEAVEVAREGGARDVTLLKCVSSYPADERNMNLRTMSHMREHFSLPVGISDHTLGGEVAIAAVVLGASVVEKHFTLSKRKKTPDSFFSIGTRELKSLVENIRRFEQIVGKVKYGVTGKEKESLKFRRSLFADVDIKKGEKFCLENVRSIRPAYGAKPKYMNIILGKKSKVDIKRGTPVKLHMVEGIENTERGEI